MEKQKKPLESDKKHVEPFLTIDEVAAILKCSKQKVYVLISVMGIPYFKFGNQVRFRQEDLLIWAENQKVEMKRGKND